MSQSPSNPPSDMYTRNKHGRHLTFPTVIFTFLSRIWIFQFKGLEAGTMRSCTYRFAKSSEGQSPVVGPAISSCAVTPTHCWTLATIISIRPSKSGPDRAQLRGSILTQPSQYWVSDVLLDPHRAFARLSGNLVASYPLLNTKLMLVIVYYLQRRLLSTRKLGQSRSGFFLPAGTVSVTTPIDCGILLHTTTWGRAGRANGRESLLLQTPMMGSLC